MSRDPEEVSDDGTDRSIRERPGSNECIREPADRRSAQRDADNLRVPKAIFRFIGLLERANIRRQAASLMPCGGSE